MTKRDLVVKIAADTNLIQSDVASVVQKTLDYIAEELVSGRKLMRPAYKSAQEPREYVKLKSRTSSMTEKNKK